VSSPKHHESGTLNVGERLYQKGRKKQEEQERKRRELYEELERKKQAELIFHPQLVTKTQQVTAENTSKEILSKEEELIMYGRMLHEKKEMARIINE
jgi:hypothetical protein